MFCNKCGQQIPDESQFCKFCGVTLTATSPQTATTDVPTTPQPVVAPNRQSSIPPVAQQQAKDKNLKGLAIAGLVCAAVGLFVFPLLGILGIVFGCIVFSKTPKEEKEWRKAIWQYKDKARGMAMLALCWGVIDVIWFVVKLF